MNRVNPLYIIVLLSVLILFLFFKISETKSELREAKVTFKESQGIVTQLLAYKRVYGDKKHSKEALQKIVTQPSFKKAGVSFHTTSKGMKISAIRVTWGVLNSLMTKIFNGPYRIKTLSIKRDDVNYADLRMEIVW